MNDLQSRQFSKLFFSSFFRLPNHLEFTECFFDQSCRSLQGSINGYKSHFKTVVAASDVALNDCYAEQVISERFGVTWFNLHPAFVYLISALSNIVVDGVSGYNFKSHAGSITAQRGAMVHLIARKSLDLDRISANQAATFESADLTSSLIFELRAFDRVRLTASHVQILILNISQKKGFIELNERSTIQKVVIIPGDETPEITLCGNGSIPTPILCRDQAIVIFNHLNRS